MIAGKTDYRAALGVSARLLRPVAAERSAGGCHP